MDGLQNLIPLASYIVMALGIFWMGQACGAKRPWLSFIPFANNYAIGLVAEKDGERLTGKSKPYRKILLGLQIAVSAMCLVFVCLILGLVISILAALASYIGLSLTDPSNWEAIVIDPAAREFLVDTAISHLALFLFLIVLVLAILVVAIIYMVQYYIAIWHIYKLYDEKNATLWMVLTLVGQLIPYAIGSLVAPVIVLVLSLNKKPNLGNGDANGGEQPAGPAPWENV